MEIRVERNDLATELALVQGIVERKNSIPILSNVLCEARGGELRISATDLDVSLRASWIKDKGERKRETPLGVVTSLEPEIATSSGDLSTPLADDELLVLAKMTNPFADGGERTRLVVTIAGAR